MTIFSMIEGNIEALKKQAYDLEMNWVAGKKPSLHPQTASMVLSELEGIKEDLKSFETRTMSLIERMKETISG